MFKASKEFSEHVPFVRDKGKVTTSHFTEEKLRLKQGERLVEHHNITQGV